MPILREKHSRVRWIRVFKRTWINISIRCALNCSLWDSVCIVSRSMAMCSSPSLFDLRCSSSSLSASLLSPKHPLFWGKKTLKKRAFFPLLFCHQGCYFYLSSPRNGKRGQVIGLLEADWSSCGADSAKEMSVFRDQHILSCFMSVKLMRSGPST